MPRLLHMADVHLGARHQDLGDAAAAQRERQFAAFARAITLAVAERVDAVLIAGDLFDSNDQPRRSVERAAGELRRLVDAGIPVVLIPGTHDCYEPGSIYRTYDLAAMAGAGSGTADVTVLTPAIPEVVLPGADAVVYGRVFDTKRAPASPLAGFTVPRDSPATWRVGMLHGSLRVAGKVERDDVLFTDQEIAASGLDYLALGHWHSLTQGRHGSTTWAYSGAPEPVAVDQDRAGKVLMVDLSDDGGSKAVRVDPRQVGRTRFETMEVDAGEIGTQEALVRRIQAASDPDLVLSVRIVGVRPDALDLDEDEARTQAAGGLFRLLLQDRSVPEMPEGPALPPDTIAGAFARSLSDRITAAEASGDAALGLELRESLRLGRHLLDDAASVTLG